jgi:probable HAF family extracellular repeat protein
MGLVDIGDLPGGSPYAAAQAVSADGSIVVGQSLSDLGNEAFVWTQLDGMQPLGDLVGGPHFSAAVDLSADGAVIVGFGMTDQGEEAFRWTQGIGLVGLGDLPGGTLRSSARAVSADGSVVVGTSNSVVGDEAFVWTAGGGMRSLWEVLVNDLHLDLTGWTLGEALDISADGTTIVGRGVNPSGHTEAWIAVIPEPATATSIMVIGLIGAVRRRGATMGAGRRRR